MNEMNLKHTLFFRRSYILLCHTRYYIQICFYLSLFNPHRKTINIWIQQTMWTGEKWDGRTCNISQRKNGQAGSFLYVFFWWDHVLFLCSSYRCVYLLLHSRLNSSPHGLRSLTGRHVTLVISSYLKGNNRFL